MQRIRPKQPRIQLDPSAYDDLRLHVLQRDAWRCQICDSRQNLEVHHKNFRSQLGSDDDFNLITLCARCHERLHRSR